RDERWVGSDSGDPAAPLFSQLLPAALSQYVQRFPVRRQLALGQRKIDGRSFIGSAIGPDFSAVSLHDPLHDSEAETRTFKLGGCMEPLEHAEHLVRIP